MYALGDNADGIFTSGGTQSNLMGLLLARDWIVKRIAGHSVQQAGLPNFYDKLRIVCSGNIALYDTKVSFFTGLGERAVHCVASNYDGSINITALAEALQSLKMRGLIPFAVVGTAGTTDHGAIDNLSAMADSASQHEAWFHVDGAYGGALILSSRRAY